jgi:hypothetical protein
MRTIKELREWIADRTDDEIIFCWVYDKSDADDFAEEQMEQPPLQDNEWSEIVNKLNNDEGIWREIVDSWQYYLETKLSGRNKGNDNSQ